MDRRESLKGIFVGSLAGGLVVGGCAPENDAKPASEEATAGYGRTPEEALRDEKLMADVFFTAHEMETVAVLCDVILPASGEKGSANEADVPGFIEFMVKDIPNHQLPIRGGIMWLDNRCNTMFNSDFKSCTNDQQMKVCDEIAYPEVQVKELQPGIKFFTLMRDLTLTGYYTTRMGIDDLGYVGNTPNVWDGVPDEVLAAHGMAYDKEWLAKCVDQTKRGEIAQWDDEGNLLT